MAIGVNYLSKERVEGIIRGELSSRGLESLKIKDVIGMSPRSFCAFLQAELTDSLFKKMQQDIFTKNKIFDSEEQKVFYQKNLPLFRHLEIQTNHKVHQLVQRFNQGEPFSVILNAVRGEINYPAILNKAFFLDNSRAKQFKNSVCKLMSQMVQAKL